MLKRCYSKSSLKQRPTYENCSVCDEWLIFSKFKAWMESQDWEGKQLDKDLLGNGKLYSPDTCCFVESWLNSIFSDCGASRGEFPIGVYWNTNRQMFVSRLRINGRLTHIGYFDDEEKASWAYLRAKREYVLSKMTNYPDEGIKKEVLRRVSL